LYPDRRFGSSPQTAFGEITPRFPEGDFRGLWLQLRTAQVRYGQVKSNRTDQRTEADFLGVWTPNGHDTSKLSLLNLRGPCPVR
jgi:hypothetical protein